MTRSDKETVSAVIAKEQTIDIETVQTIPAGNNGTRRPTKIQLVRDGDVIQRIEVHCGCGQVSQLICKYE